MLERPPLLAGRWYPKDAAACRAAIDAHARSAVVDGGGDARGLVAPHAGWSYSGDLAGAGHRALADRVGAVDVVVVFGGHLAAGHRPRLFRGAAWGTPLGPLPVARALVAALDGALDLVDEPVRPARADNAVELHLPFVKRFHKNPSLLVLGVPPTPAAPELGRAVGRLLSDAGVDAAFVASTDLTHCGPAYGLAPPEGDPVAWTRRNDGGFLDRLAAADAPGLLAHALSHASACCPGAVAATLGALEGYGTPPAPRLLGHTLSYDVRPAESFVGYGAALL